MIKLSFLKSFLKKESGFGLIEILASLAIIGIGIGGNLFIQKRIFKSAAAIKADVGAVNTFNETYFHLKKSEVCESLFLNEIIPEAQEGEVKVVRFENKLSEIVSEDNKVIAIGDYTGNEKALRVSDMYVEVEGGMNYFAIEFERDLTKSEGLKVTKRRFPLNLKKDSSSRVTSCYDTIKNVKKTVTRRACNGNDGLTYNEETDSCTPRMLPVHFGCVANKDDSDPAGGFIHSIYVNNGTYKFNCRQKGITADTACNAKERARGFNASGLDCRKIVKTDLKPMFIGDCSAQSACEAQAKLGKGNEGYFLNCQKISDPVDCQTANIKRRDFNAIIPTGETFKAIPGLPAPFNQCECTGVNQKRCPSEYIGSIQSEPNECGVKCNDVTVTPPVGELSYQWETLSTPGPATCTQERSLISTSCGNCSSITGTKTCTYTYSYSVTQAEGECGTCNINSNEVETAEVPCVCGNDGETCCSGNICNTNALVPDTASPICICNPIDNCPLNSAAIGEACDTNCPCSDGLCINGSCQSCGGEGQTCSVACPCEGSMVCDNGTCANCGLEGLPPCSTDCTPPLQLNPVTGLCENCPANLGEACSTTCPCTSPLACLTNPSGVGEICTSCGGSGQPCCPGDSCDTGGAPLTCNTSNNMCEPCGTMGNTCSLECPCTDGSLCGTSGLCEGCGEQGQPCCENSSGTQTCSPSLLCNSTTQTCVECGTLGNSCDANCPCTADGQTCEAGVCVEEETLVDCQLGCTEDSDCESQTCNIASQMCAPTSGDMCSCGETYPNCQDECVSCEWGPPTNENPCDGAEGLTLTVNHKCYCNDVLSDDSQCVGDPPSIIHDCTVPPPEGCQLAQLGEVCSFDSDCCTSNCVFEENEGTSTKKICADPSTPTCIEQGNSCDESGVCCENLTCFDHDGDGARSCEPPVSCSASSCSNGETCCPGLSCNSSGLCVTPSNCCSDGDICCYDSSIDTGSVSAAQCKPEVTCSQTVLPGEQCGLNCSPPTTSPPTTVADCVLPSFCMDRCNSTNCSGTCSISLETYCGGQICNTCSSPPTTQPCQYPPECSQSCSSCGVNEQCTTNGSEPCGTPCYTCSPTTTLCEYPTTCMPTCNSTNCAGTCTSTGAQYCGYDCYTCVLESTTSNGPTGGPSSTNTTLDTSTNTTVFDPGSTSTSCGPCASTAECPTNHICQFNGAFYVCWPSGDGNQTGCLDQNMGNGPGCINLGEMCLSSSDCCQTTGSSSGSNICSNGLCTYVPNSSCSQFGEACGTDSSCCTGSVCTNGTCSSPSGEGAGTPCTGTGLGQCAPGLFCSPEGICE